MIELTNIKKTKLNDCFNKDKKIVIIGHHNPDGDAVGGVLGLYKVLKNRKNNVKPIIPNQTTDFLKWLPLYEELYIHSENEIQTEQLINESDVIICIDFNEYKRVGALEKPLENSKALKILIDHHPGPDKRFDYIFSYTNVSSASEIVYDLINILEFNKYFDKDAAVCLYTGIMTDTINFSVNSSEVSTFLILSELLKFEIDKDDIYDRVYNNFSQERLQLVGYLLHKKLKIIKSSRTAYIILTLDEKDRFKFREGDHEGIVNMPLSIKGIGTSIIAIENPDHIKISSRSKNQTDVNLLSRKYFNGGGHKNAAGGTLYIPCNQVEKYIKDSIKDFESNNVN